MPDVRLLRVTFVSGMTACVGGNGWTLLAASGDTVNVATQQTGKTKTVGRRVPSTGGLAAAQPFLDLVIRLRGDKPFLPRGVHRFRSFEESQAWSIRMMGRRRKPARQT